MRNELHSTFILHSRPYRNSSLILDVFTLEHGRVGLVARGARSKKSNQAGLYQSFLPLLVSWFGRGELQTLQKIETAGSAIYLTGKSLYSGFYLNELIMRLIHRNDPHPVLFQQYFETLKGLHSCANVEALLRTFEKCLLQEIGYGLLLEYDVNTGKKIDMTEHYLYQPEHGPVKVTDTDQPGLIVSGRTLDAILNNRYDDTQSLAEAKQLLRREIAGHLGDKPLKSRDLYKQQQNVL